METKTKIRHTPGPWAIDADEPAIVHGTKQNKLVADCRVRTSTSYTERDPAENAANARLIAAAPELLEALEAARSMLYHRLSGKDWNLLAASIQVIDDTIAKAKGEA